MIERPCCSSSLAREKTASAPSPFSCETRFAIRLGVMSESLSPYLSRFGSSSHFRSGRRSDRDAQPADEAGKHFKRSRGKKQFDKKYNAAGSRGIPPQRSSRPGTAPRTAKDK